MTPRRWAILAWGAFLVGIIGMCAAYGGRNCEVPKSGPFRRLLYGRTYVQGSSWRDACIEVK